MKKQSNDPIPKIVDLGDGRYEFCFNHTSNDQDGVTRYECDIVVCEGIPDAETEKLIDIVEQAVI